MEDSFTNNTEAGGQTPIFDEEILIKTLNKLPKPESDSNISYILMRKKGCSGKGKGRGT